MPAHNNNDAVAVAATFLLADVALLFVASDEACFTYSEKAVVMSMILLFGLSVLHLRGFIFGIPVWFSNCTIFMMSTAVTATISAYQYYTADRVNKQAAVAIKRLDLDALDGL